ncbi:MAG TPA: hypothetical protein DEF51_15340 [Myxococcales bacterium]|nr:hypothetical protein [Myxococcales bacterium]
MWKIALVTTTLALFGCGTEPAPGSTDAGPVADPVDHCIESEFWMCRREEFTGRATDEASAACFAAIDPMCDGASWPAGCMPSASASEACIDLLRDGERIDIATPDLLERFDDCALCP